MKFSIPMGMEYKALVYTILSMQSGHVLIQLEADIEKFKMQNWKWKPLKSWKSFSFNLTYGEVEHTWTQCFYLEPNNSLGWSKELS